MTPILNANKPKLNKSGKAVILFLIIFISMLSMAAGLCINNKPADNIDIAMDREQVVIFCIVLIIVISFSCVLVSVINDSSNFEVAQELTENEIIEKAKQLLYKASKIDQL